MRIVDVLAVAIRIAGLLLLIRILEHGPYWLQALNIISPDRPTPEDALYAQYAIFIVLALTSFLMIKFSGTLARLLVGRLSDDSPLLEENGQAIQIAGITIIGVYTLTWAVPDLFQNVLMLSAMREQFGNSGYLNEVKVNIAVTAIEIGIGLYCSIGAHGITKILNRLRS